MQLPKWRVWAVIVIAWLRRHFPRLRGTAHLMLWLYPDQVRHRYPIVAQISYENRFKMRVNTQSLIEWNLFFNGRYEPHIVNLLYSLLTAGDTVIDIGANIGVHALVMSKVVGNHGRVLAIEPHPQIRQTLGKNLIENQINNVDIVPIALSDHAGSTVLFEGGEFNHNTGQASMWANTGAEGAGIEVTLGTLDDVVNSVNYSDVKLIKIDIQGAEKSALLGGQDTLVRDKPYILFEYDQPAWDMANANLREVVTFLETLGYDHFYEITTKGKLVSFDASGGEIRFVELLAMPNTRTLPKHFEQD